MIDVSVLAQLAEEIVVDMSSGACQETVTQTAQILDLGNGKRAAVRITVTTDSACFL